MNILIGTKIPHYSIFGDTVEIAGLMESSGQPMKVDSFFLMFSYKVDSH